MTTTRQKAPHRNRFSRNTAEADVRDRIRDLELRRTDSSDYRVRIDELKRLLKYWGMEKR